ncbi:ATP-binding protein [Actinomadura yumaensis]|uniref:ATP-binding protein n=1 Tax=Actinomadura yumaensis TaxID=111807 RepID=UPI00361F0DF7
MTHATRLEASSAIVRTSSPVLIGRGRELEALTAATAAAPSVVFVEGEAGVGKTRLVTELVTALRGGPAWPAVRHCQPLRDPFPYGVIFECLRSCGARLGEPSAVTGALRPYLPELADRLPPPPEPLGDPAAERHRLFRAVRDLLAALGRTVLVIEDLHWADEGTRQMLRFVMSDPPPGLSLVATFRREDLPADAPLGGAFRPPPGTTSAHLVLGPLDAAGVRGMVEAILGDRAVSPGFAEVMRQRTAGIPFVVEEMIYALRDHGGALRTDGACARRLLDDLEVPALLREAMLERLHTLPPAPARSRRPPPSSAPPPPPRCWPPWRGSAAGAGSPGCWTPRCWWRRPRTSTASGTCWPSAPSTTPCPVRAARRCAAAPCGCSPSSTRPRSSGSPPTPGTPGCPATGCATARRPPTRRWTPATPTPGSSCCAPSSPTRPSRPPTSTGSS